MSDELHFYDTIEDCTYAEFESAVHDFIRDRNANKNADDPLTLLPMEEAEKTNKYGEWQAFAKDSKHLYKLKTIGGGITIDYPGIK